MHLLNVSKESMLQAKYDDFALYLNHLMQQVTDDTTIVFAKDIYCINAKYACEQYCYITNNDHGLKKILFYLCNKSNIVIDGSGAQFLMSGRIVPFYFEQCHNVTVKNLSVDYKRPFFTQGFILDATEDTLTLQIDKAQYSYRIENNHITFYGDDYAEDYIHGFLEYDPKRKSPAEHAIDWLPKQRNAVTACETAPGIVVLQGGAWQQATIGNVMTIKHEPRYVPGIVADQCADVQMQDVTVHQCGTMAFLAQFCHNVHLNHFCVQTKEGSDRVVSANADATHFVGCSGEVCVENCIFESQLDDAFNVHGNYLKVAKVLAPDCVIAEIGHFQQEGISGLAVGRTADILRADTMLQEQSVFIKEKTALNARYILLEFAECVDLVPNVAYCIDDAEQYPTVVFRNNVVQHNRARGILVTTRKSALIENNVFKTNGAAIKISGDMNFWFEAGSVSDVLVRGNHLETTCNDAWGHAVIDIDPEMKCMVQDAFYHQRITIEQNDVVIKNWPLVYGKSVEALTVQNNRLICEKAMDEIPLVLEYVGDLIVENNELVTM